jgi:hypothetical protein
LEELTDFLRLLVLATITAAQAGRMFSMVFEPPRFKGMRWSISIRKSLPQ